MIALASSALAAPVVEEASPERLLDRCVAAADAEIDVPALPEPTRSDHVAVVVGVPCHRQPGLPSLAYSSRDAARVGQVLAEDGYSVVELTTLVDGADLQDAIDRAASLLEPGGTLVLYFSGHGVLRETDGELTRWLVLSDTDLDRVTDTALRVSALEDRLRATGAATRVVVQDTCFASGGKGLGLPDHAKGLAPVEVPRLASGDVRLWASRFFEQALEDPDRRASVYTDQLLAALADPDADLDGDGCVGLMEAHRLAARRTAEERGGFQVPVSSALGVGDVVLGCTPHAPTRVLLVPPPEGWAVSLTRDGAPVDPSGALEPGEYRVRVEDDDGHRREERVRLDGGDRLDVRRDLVAPSVTLVAGGLGRLTEELPPLGTRAELRVDGPGLTLRPLLGVVGGWSPRMGDVSAAELRLEAGVGLALPSRLDLSVAPVLDGGVVFRTLDDEDRTDPGQVWGAGLDARLALGRLVLSLRPGLDVLPLGRSHLAVGVFPDVVAGVGVKL